MALAPHLPGGNTSAGGVGGTEERDGDDQSVAAGDGPADSLELARVAAREAIIALRTPYDALEDELFAPVEYYLMLCARFGIFLNPGLLFVPGGPRFMSHP